MGKTCYQADDHQWGAGKTHLISADGLMTRCGKSIAVVPGRFIRAASYNCKGCRAAKERDAAQLLREQQPRRDVYAPAEHWPRASDFLMPFGKHRGTPVYDLDDGYLEWLRDNVDLYGGLRQAVYAELEERGIEDGDGGGGES